MEVKKLGEHGYEYSLVGLSLSKKQKDMERMKVVACNLAGKGGGHDKFLSHIDVWIIIQAPIFWWNEFDQYKLRVPDIVDMNTQSESTMHTLEKSALTQEDFEYPISENYLKELNDSISKGKSIEELKNDLPQGFLQRREIKLNYMCIWNIYQQRKNHRLPQWHIFLDDLLKLLEHPEFIVKDYCK